LAKNSTQEPIKRLHIDLERENTVLAGCVKSFQRLNKMARTWERLQGAEDSSSADQQRSSTLLLTDHIVDLSDILCWYFSTPPGTGRDGSARVCAVAE
jgi:hypothetical protein